MLLLGILAVLVAADYSANHSWPLLSSFAIFFFSFHCIGVFGWLGGHLFCFWVHSCYAAEYLHSSGQVVYFEIMTGHKNLIPLLFSLLLTIPHYLWRTSYIGLRSIWASKYGLHGLDM